MTLLDELRAAIEKQDNGPDVSPGTWRGLAARAADEIERLQTLVGAATAGPSLADLKRDLPTAPKANG